MGRLTGRDENGNVYSREEAWILNANGVINKDEMYKIMMHLAEKLAEYEDLEEQGKLLKLPCVVGDRVFRIDTDEKTEKRDIEIYDIDNIVILNNGSILLKHDTYDGVICELENIVTGNPYLDFYRCFLTREEAEAALKEMSE